MSMKILSINSYVYEDSVYQFICLWRLCLSIHVSIKVLSINLYVYEGSVYQYICLCWLWIHTSMMKDLSINSNVYEGFVYEGSVYQFICLWRVCLWIHMSMKVLSINIYVFCQLSFFVNKIQEYLSTDIFNYLSKLCYPSTYLPNYLPILLSIYLSWPVSFTYPAIRSVSTVALIGTCRIYTIHTLY